MEEFSLKSPTRTRVGKSMHIRVEDGNYGLTWILAPVSVRRWKPQDRALQSAQLFLVLVVMILGI